MTQCYFDKKPTEKTSEHFPFCSAECHEKWAKTNYNPISRESQKKYYTIEECQRRIKEIIEEKRAKRQPQREMFEQDV